MKLIIISALAAAGVIAAAPALANLDMAKKSGCLACHQVDKKTVGPGPAYADIAKKYAGDKGAEAKLIDKVKKGGSGVWGPIPMMANSPQVKDDDIKAIVKWILSGAK